MKRVVSVFLAACVLFIAGCQKNSSTSGNMELTNAAPPNVPAGMNTNIPPNATNGPIKGP